MSNIEKVREHWAKRAGSFPPVLREAYRATFSDDGDVLVDMKFAIVVGIKR